MGGCEYMKKKFSVFMGSNSENYDRIFNKKLWQKIWDFILKYGSKISVRIRF